MMQEQQGCCVVETTSVVCSGPGDWAWRSRGLETWRSRGLGAWRSRGRRAWRSRGLDLGLGASAWGLLAVAVKVKPAIVLQVLVASDCGHHCYLASKSAYGIVVT